MNVGGALGLLAGLGAINAMRGGKDGKRFTSLIDMIDGGGAGQSGDRFEGGGLLSMLGNLFAKPYEAQDNVERIAANTAAAKTVAPTKAVPTAPAPSYANMNMGEAGRGSMPPVSDPYAYLFQGQGQRPQLRQPAGTPTAGYEPVTQATPSDSAEYAAFMDRVKNDPMFAGVINNPVAMQNIFKMYQANMGR